MVQRNSLLINETCFMLSEIVAYLGSDHVIATLKALCAAQFVAEMMHQISS